MPIFRYSGYKPDGTDVSGTVEASGLSDAASKIREEGVFPGEITEPLIRRRKEIFQRTDETFLPNMTRQLSILLSSGVPMIDALQSLTAENRGFYSDMLIAIKEHVSGGAGLSRAMAGFSDYFPEFYIHMVQAGEQSGTMEKMLMRLADFLEGQNAVRSKIRSSMIYPLFMTGVSIVVLSFLFTFVVPKIVKIFEDTESSLPFITQVLISISNVFIHYWWAFILVTAVLYLPGRIFLRKHRLFLDSIMLRMPGNIMQSLYYSRFARTLGFLIEGGLPMLKALRLSATSVGNKALENSVLVAEERVAGGQRLSASLERFSPFLIQLISTGEKSGKLSETLHRAADAYEDEFNRSVNKAISIFEPSMILFMGIIVAFIVLAVLLPIFQLNQLVH